MHKSKIIFSLLCLGAGVGVFFIPPPENTKNDKATSVQEAAAKPSVVNSKPAGEVLTWAHERSNIAPDTDVHYGILPNGMKYIIMPNTEPPGQVSMRLHVAAGSLHEDEDQRGLAHFLEHMVFDGTKSFPEASKLIPEMQRLGIAFGAHANAYTTFDETVYKLDLPNNKSNVIELGLKVMRDFADGALLREEDIDQERGVILAEKTSRNSAHMTVLEQELSWLLPSSLIPKRLPIGTEETIKSVPRERFLDFYNEFYVPENITFVYTGDISKEDAESQINETFQSFQREGSQRADTSIGSIPKAQGFRTKVFAHEELEDTTIEIAALHAIEHQVDNTQERAKQLPLQLANTMLNRRFARMVKEENSVITSAYASTGVMWKTLEFGQVSATAKEDNWKPVVALTEQEIRRVIEHGFSEPELKEAIANLKKQYSNRVKSSVTRLSSNLADDLVRHVHNDSVFSTPKLDLEILEDSLKTITVKSCHEAFAKFWDTSDIHLSLKGKKEPNNALADLQQLYQDSRSIAVESLKIEEAGEFAYNYSEKGATVTTQRFIEDLAIHQLELSNGVRINLKQTDFKKNSINIQVNFGNGILDLPKNLPGLQTLTQVAIDQGGLGKHSGEELRQIFAGQSISSHFNVADENFSLSGATTPEDLETQLAYMCAQLSDPGLRPEALRLFQAQLPSIYHSLRFSVGGAQLDMMTWLGGNDSRLGFPEESLMDGYSLQDVSDWILPILKSAPMEVSIVGDFDPEQIQPLLARTFGSLPQRDTLTPVPKRLRQITAPKTPSQKTFSFESKEEPANAMVAWKLSDAMLEGNVSEVRRLNVLSRILSDRMRIKIREELGDAYSPFSYVSSNPAFMDYSYLIASSKGTPEAMEKISQVILEIAHSLSKDGAEQDELDRALNPTLSSLKESLRQNSYWLNTVMLQSQKRPQVLDWARQRDADYSSISLEEINALAKKYLTPSNAHQLTLMPNHEE